MRGAKIEADAEGYLFPALGESWKIAYHALTDVVDWLGFDGAGLYGRALNREGPRIFERARY